MTADTILVIEDDANDLILLEHALREAQLDNPIQVATDGSVGMEILKNILANAKFGAPLVLPLLVLLDLKTPKVNGLEFLNKIRGTLGLANLTVIVLTGTDLQSDVLLAYELGARSYLLKPPRAADLCAIVRAITSEASKSSKVGSLFLPGVRPGFIGPLDPEMK